MRSDIYNVPATVKETVSEVVRMPVVAKEKTRNFSMAQVNRITNDFFSGSLTADQAIYNSIHALRNRARELERNDSHVRKFLIMARTNIVGAKGIRLQSRAGDIVKGKYVPDKNDQRVIESGYVDFSKAWNFSLNTRQGRRDFAQTAVQRLLVDGEVIVQIARGGAYAHGLAVQMIDSERLDHTFNRRASSGINEIRMGVEIDRVGKPIAYHFLDEIGPTGRGVTTVASTRRRIPAAQILHIYRAERPSQTRGISHLAPTGLRAKLLDGIETAVQVGYKVAASKMGFISPGEEYEGKQLDLEDIPSDVAPGMIDLLPKGVNFESFDPGYPNADFDQFKKSIVRDIASGFGVSYPELGNDYSGVSYSAGQIGVHADIALWSDLQQFWIESFEEPIFRAWLPMAITTGAVKLPISKVWKFEQARFQPPRRKHIDPLKTHNAQRVAFGDLSRSPFEIAAENGEDLEDVFDAYADAIQMLNDRGLPIPESWGCGIDLSTITEEPPA